MALVDNLVRLLLHDIFHLTDQASSFALMFLYMLIFLLSSINLNITW